MTTFRAEEFLEGLDFLRFSYAFPCFRLTLFLFLLQGCELFQEKRGLVKWGDFFFLETPAEKLGKSQILKNYNPALIFQFSFVLED
ncbi:hypothetical protein CEXT_105881 [Caerostris extrusa]|uniref:Lipoprotein n=1 Tax=Caerostris extrusa TaxID=172846 RepID=A0AAV4UNS2_CAEEX|nr:hypothetical protein CEXT_105881 [Caerostris extrusa]